MARAKTSLTAAVRRIPKGSSVLVAVSGGVDSISLLHAIIQISKIHKLNIQIAHVDHKIRKDSAKDAALVKEIAEKYGIKFHLKKANKIPKSNLEAWGRELRYTFFKEILNLEKLDWILTAHTASDLAETFLMKLISNKELRGIDAIDTENRIFRPLLDVSKKDLIKYAKQHKLVWIEDSTNQSTVFFRNKVRLELIPFLENKFDVRIEEILAHRQNEISAIYNSLAFVIKQDLQEIICHKFGSKSWLLNFRSILNQRSQDYGSRLIAEFFLSRLGYRIGIKQAQLIWQLLMGFSQAVIIAGKIEYRRKNGGIQEIKL